MLRKFKRGGTWYVRGTVAGQSVYRSLRTADAGKAEEARARLEATLYDRRVAGKPSYSFAEALIAYLRDRDVGATDALVLQHLNDWFGGRSLGDIDQEAVDAYIAAKMPDAAPATKIRSVYTPLSAVLNDAAARGWCEKPAFRRPKPPRGKTRWLTYDEADRLIDHAADHLKPLLVFLFHTGARIGEAIGLDWRDVDLTRGTAAFLDTKNGEARGVPLHERVVVALANLPHREGPVFRKPDGKPYSEYAHSPIRTAFKAACRRAGIEGFRVHDTRHTFASWYVMAGGDLRSLAELLGHKSLAMVMRYSHLAPDHLRAGVARIGAKSVQQIGPRAVND